MSKLEKKICLELGTMTKRGLAFSLLKFVYTLLFSHQVYLASGEKIGMIRKSGFLLKP